MKTTTIQRPGDRSLHVLQAIADNERAKLFLVHGYGEYSDRYKHLISHCNQVGISVYTHDLIGHGHSQGLRAYIPSKEILMDDLSAVRDHFSLGADTFLMGHSLGGLIAVTSCLDAERFPWKGLVTSAAALEIDPEMSPILQKIAPIIGAIFPKLKTTPLDITYLTRSDDVRAAYIKDELIYTDGMRARTGALTLKLIKIARQQFGRISIPLLAMHGGVDKVTMPGGTKKLFEDASSSDKTLKIYDGLYHELVNEPEREEVMKKISTWILERA